MSDINDKDYQTTMSIATKVASFADIKIKKNKKNFDSILLALTIAGLIINIIRLWMTCKDKKTLATQFRNPSLMFKILLKREVGKHFGKDEKNTVYESLLEVAKTLSEQEINNLIIEVEKNK